MIVLAFTCILQLLGCGDSQLTGKKSNDQQASIRFILNSSARIITREQINQELEASSGFRRPRFIEGYSFVPSYYLLWLKKINSLNAYSLDFHELEAYITTLYFAKDTHIINSKYRTGFKILFTPAGVVTDTWITTITDPTTYKETGQYDFYFICRIQTDNSPLDALLYDEEYPGTFLGLEYKRNFDRSQMIDSDIDIDTACLVSFSIFADAYDGSTIQSIIGEYIADNPMSYQLDSSPLSMAEFNDPALEFTFIECAEQGYREMSPSEISSIAKTTKGYRPDIRAVWDGEKYSTSMEVLELDGYWYLTLLPFYRQTETGIGMREFIRNRPLSDILFDHETLYFSAENPIVLCFPVHNPT
jgi:hypothetical protein